jgi:16S rRNA processing protein RimM
MTIPAFFVYLPFFFISSVMPSYKRFDTTNCRRIGTVLKAFRHQGEILCLFEGNEIPGDLLTEEFFFFDVEGELVPFHVSMVRLQDENTAVMKIDDIDTPEQAGSFRNRAIYLPSKTTSSTTNKQISLHELAGYKIEDKEKGELGIIEDMIVLPEQVLLRILHHNKEILIPAVEEIIVKIDRRGKRVYIDAPEGLIDLYLNQ